MANTYNGNQLDAMDFFLNTKTKTDKQVLNLIVDSYTEVLR